MRVKCGSEEIGLYYRRRGGALRVGGRKFSETVFQQPSQIEGTECESVNERLATALWRARKREEALWARFSSSLPLFLLANADTTALDDERCLMLSAIAFERLIAPKTNGAKGLASAFSEVWNRFPAKTIADARRVKTDSTQEWQAEQLQWPLRQKWMKELYEIRNSEAHRERRPELSSNWNSFKHMVIAAFIYPLTVKIILD